MSKKTKISKDFFGIITETVLFACIFLGCCLLISTNCPLEEETIVSPVASTEKEVEDNSEINEEIILDLTNTFNEQNLAKAAQDELSKKTKTSDESLNYYRNPDYKLAVEWFYTQITGDANVAKSILQYADSNDVSASLAFALAWAESRYNANAINHNSNASVDRGLFQLNSNSFPALSEADFFDAKTSTKYGLSHLKFCLDSAGNEVAALAMYNAGKNRVQKNGTPQVTLNYVSGILNYQQGLKDLFSKQVAEWNNFHSAQLVAFLTTH